MNSTGSKQRSDLPEAARPATARDAAAVMVRQLGENARRASRTLRLATTDAKNAALTHAARLLRERSAAIVAANRGDVEAAADRPAAFRDRLLLTADRVESMARGLEIVASLPDPVGDVVVTWRRPNGLEISQVRVPLGVIAVIYESRPNVTADAAGLCIKSGNAVILRGGSESLASNLAIGETLADALVAAGLPPEAAQLVPTTDRSVVHGLLRAVDHVDVVIPRGGPSLLHAIREEARVPVIQHFEGVCHTFVDRSADLARAVAICVNAKTQRPGVCNAMETMLVHEDIAARFLPEVAAALAAKGVELRGCARTREFVPGARAAADADWDAEYLDLVLAVRVVPTLEEALAHVARHSTGLADAIVTQDLTAARRFQREVDSAAVFVNASTRFTDGSEFGFGAEIGISTNRLHARGPLGVRELTTTKYVVSGDGQVRG